MRYYVHYLHFSDYCPLADHIWRENGDHHPLRDQGLRSSTRNTNEKFVNLKNQQIC